MKKEDQFVSLSDFNIIDEYLGRGFSSKVSLIENKISKRKYALKSVRILSTIF